MRPPLNEATMRKAIDDVLKYGSVSEAARQTGKNRQALQELVARARVAFPDLLPGASFSGGWAAKGGEFLLTKELPSSLPTAADLIKRRRAEFDRVHAAKEARKLIDVTVRCDGPIGISHFGDPHLDDPGTNISLVEKHVEVVKRTPGLFAANIGDSGNHWVGRLARLYGEQSTSAAESWVLVEWFISELPFLYIVNGNHGCWNGAGDPLKWLIRNQPGAFDDNGCRLNLRFPNGREVRVNARHDFRGHSMWNPAHGPAKAAQLGWRDHILIAGHLHISGYNILKDPVSGLISHAIRVASYKTHDRYADTLGLPDQNISENVVTIINPEAEMERALVTVFMDPEHGADYLTFLRKRHASGKSTKRCAA